MSLTPSVNAFPKDSFEKPWTCTAKSQKGCWRVNRNPPKSVILTEDERYRKAGGRESERKDPDDAGAHPFSIKKFCAVPFTVGGKIAVSWQKTCVRVRTPSERDASCGAGPRRGFLFLRVVGRRSLVESVRNKPFPLCRRSAQRSALKKIAQC